MTAAAAAVVVVAYTLADKTLVAPADMNAAVVVVLYLDPYLDPAGRFSKKSLDGFSIRGYMYLNRDCWISRNSLLLKPAPLVDC